MAEKILRTEYSEEMQKSYMNYSMSVITARASYIWIMINHIENQPVS